MGVALELKLVVQCRNQPNKSTLSLYKLLFCFSTPFKWLYTSNKSASVIKVGVVGVCVPRGVVLHLDSKYHNIAGKALLYVHCV